MVQKRCDTLVIGMGNMYRRDDAAGLIVARRLKGRMPDHVMMLEQSGDGAALMESWKDADMVILIDAVFSGAKPGTIYCFDAQVASILKELPLHSTHSFCVAEAVELAQALNQLPACLIIYGIEGKDFKPGIGLSSEVDGAAWRVAELVLQQVSLRNLQHKRKGRRS